MRAFPELHIGRLRSRFVSSHELDQDQVRQWHEALGEQDPSELVGRVVADDEWLLIRHLPLHLRWRPQSAAPEAGRAWLQALQMAVQAAASADEPGNVQRYRLWRHGLADLIYRSAMGEAHRQWAWQRMALIPREGLAAAEALVHGAQVLAGEPELIWPVLHHWLQAEPDTGALTAVARRVPPATWQRWLMAAPQSRFWMQVLAQQGETAWHAASSPDAVRPLSAHMPAWPVSAQALLQWVRRHPALAQQMGDVLSAWLSALAWVDAPDVARGMSRLGCARHWWQQAAHAAVAAPARQSTREPSRVAPRAANGSDTSPPHETQPGAQQDKRAAHHAHLDQQDLPEAPSLPDPDTLVHTAWAGALFWLRHLNAPGVMAHLQDQASEGLDMPVTSTSLMQAVAMGLGVPLDDPVMQVFTAGQGAEQDVAPSAHAAARLLVAEWAAWLDETLPDAPAPRMAWVCQRAGRLKLEAGWIEVHLDIDGVDTRLRRIGLDLDPGWVPFIGAVVRVCYD